MLRVKQIIITFFCSALLVSALGCGGSYRASHMGGTALEEEERIIYRNVTLKASVAGMDHGVAVNGIPFLFGRQEEVYPAPFQHEKSKSSRVPHVRAADTPIRMPPTVSFFPHASPPWQRL